MATIIDCHDGRTQLGGFLICVDVFARVCLTETTDGDFEFRIDYAYSGSRQGEGQACLPLSGNISGESHDGSGVHIGYTISNWNLTARSVGCELSAYIEYKAFPHMGPSYIFKNECFVGKRQPQKAGRRKKAKRAKNDKPTDHG